MIPIGFFPGCGGHMLMDILMQAKLKSNISIPFSEHGNAHEIKREVSKVFFEIENSLFETENQTESNDEIISIIKSIKITKPSRTPYFVLCHSPYQEQLSKYFYKTIVISYDEDDFKPIISLLHKKYHVDHCKMDNTIKIKGDPDIILSVQEWQHEVMNEIKVHQRGYDFHGERYLNIKFKELNSLPTNILFKKLSDFTKIPYENFNDSNLLKWREINAKVISEYKWFI